MSSAFASGWKAYRSFASGWKAYRIDDPELDEPASLGFYCPNCARREFGGT